MIRFIHSVPMEVCIAFSGGVDSLAVAHFLKNGGRKITLLHFNHGCQYSDRIQAECEALARSLDLPIVIGMVESERTKGQSLEDFWRRSRYRFLKSFNTPVITCHHLDDAVETWVWSSLHGEGKLIPIKNDNVIRPFLTTEKKVFIEYCNRRSLIPVQDACNLDLKFMRNYMRANITPHLFHINPGLYKTIRNKYHKQKILNEY